MIGDRYEIVERLGKGGQGTTYLGRDTRDGRTVLIKQLNIADADEWKSIELFQREARVLQQLEHPAIPKVLDALVDDDEEGVTQFYLVREFVDGTPLDEAISKGLVMKYDEVLEPVRHRFLLGMARFSLRLDQLRNGNERGYQKMYGQIPCPLRVV